MKRTQKFRIFRIFPNNPPLLLACLFLFAGCRQYTQSGSIKKDEVWKNKVLLKGDIVVEEGVTLSILPGCEIRYFSGKPVNQTHYIRNTAMGSMDVLQDERIEIVVEGKLEAAGEPKKKIRFTGGKNSGGILFLSRTPGSKLTWAGFGDMPIALRCYGEASPDLENLDISDCVLGGIGLWDTASPLIKNCSIKNCGHGIGA
ncbi:MAG TPA: hypothetical protein VJC03_00855, partial [bacterium]|nr:hypothetical protein [bacterium]